MHSASASARFAMSWESLRRRFSNVGRRRDPGERTGKQRPLSTRGGPRFLAAGAAAYGAFTRSMIGRSFQPLWLCHTRRFYAGRPIDEVQPALPGEAAPWQCL
jgi:hypothetical protein